MSLCREVGQDVAPTVLRRLSNLEYQLTLQDLFQLPGAPAIDGIPPDVAREGFRTIASLQSVSAQHLRSYAERAATLADQLFADTARRTKVIGCDMAAAGCLKAFVGRFGKLAYRRALTSAEIDALTNRAVADALDATDQFRFVFESLLSSPGFLYRVEVGNTPDGLSTLAPQELVARLSFTLWGRAPSSEMLDGAATGALDTPAGLAQTTTTMLADNRTRTFYEAFFKQWLAFDQLLAPASPPAGWSDTLLTDMTRETDDVLADFAWGNRDFLGILTANYTRPTAALAKFYGLPAPGGSGMVEMPASHPRAATGILTHPSLLSAKRDGDAIAMRGNWVRQTFLCRGLGIPAAVAEQLGELLVGLNRVEIVRKRNTETACKGCHSLIDPVGVGFAQFDAVGRHDPTVDASVYGVASGLPDAVDPPFASVSQLAAKLQQMPEVAACLSQKVFVFANGRDPVRADSCATESASRAFADNDHSFPALLRGLVTDPTFRMRRAPAVMP